MSRGSPVLALAALIAFASACRGHSDVTAPVTEAPATPNTAITTDSLTYTLAVWPLGYHVRFGMIYTNTQSSPVQFSICPGLLPSFLQRWNDTAWELAWQPSIAFSCSVTDITVAPGGTHQAVEDVWGASPATKFIPAWSRADPSGTYRAVWNIQRAPGSADAAVPIPIEERVTNNFTLRLPPE